MHHSFLLVVYLESLNFTPRVLIGAFSVTTEAVMKDKQTLSLLIFHNHHCWRLFIRQARPSSNSFRGTLYNSRCLFTLNSIGF